MADVHPAATVHLPVFITAPGQTDVLFVVVAVFLLLMILLVGNMYLRLHSLPEQVAHKTEKIQFEIVAILSLIALFTHNHLFWIAALLLAFIELPDFSTHFASMAGSLERMAKQDHRRQRPDADPAETATRAGEPIEDDSRMRPKQLVERSAPAERTGVTSDA